MTRAQIDQIARRVAEKHGLGHDAILSKCRAHELARARWEACVEAVEAGATKAMLARYFGVDWATIHHGVKRHRGEI